MKVYVLSKHQGEYSDYHMSLVCVFSTELAAKKHADKCVDLIREYMKEVNDRLFESWQDLDAKYEKRFEEFNLGYISDIYQAWFEIEEFEIDQIPKKLLNKVKINEP